MVFFFFPSPKESFSVKKTIMVEPEGCSNEDLNIFIVFPVIFNSKYWEKEGYKINFQELDKWGKGLE